MKIGITSDCSSGLEYASFKHNIKIARSTIIFGETELVDGVDITADEFYKKLKESDIVPSTSAPSPAQLIGCAEAWKQEGCTDVIHFPISFGLSKYGENLQMVSDDYVEGINYHVFDCHSACLGEGYCAHYAEILAAKGYGIEEIFSECQKLTDHSEGYFVVNDLKYLVKNGRLNAASGFIGSLMKIKPILLIGKSGTIDVFEKVRTQRKALDRLIEIVKEKTQNAKEVIYIVQHSDCEDDARAFLETVKPHFDNAKRFEFATVPPTVGAHIGCGVLSLGYIILDDLKEEI